MSLRWRISIALATLAMGAATLAALGAYFATADQLSLDPPTCVMRAPDSG